jgi:sigma-B regulation protein RsbU (phosphoserine phosphatase)
MALRRERKQPDRASRLPAPPPLFRPLTSGTPEPGRVAFRRLLLERWPGRLLLGGVALRVVLWLVDSLAGANAVTDLLGTVARLAIIIGGAVVLWWLFQRGRRRFLWRVRERLIVSYLFIAVVPALLIAAFFLLGAVLLIQGVSAYLFVTGVNVVKDDAQLIARIVTEELERSGGGAAVQAVLDRQVARVQSRYPELSIVVVPRQPDVSAQPGMAPRPAARRTSLVRAGAWSHATPPDHIPAWIGQGGFADLVVPGGDAKGVRGGTGSGRAEPLEFVERAVAHARSREWSVVVDVPLDEAIWASIELSTGVEMLDAQPFDAAGSSMLASAGSVAARPPFRYIPTRTGGKWVIEPPVYVSFQDWVSRDGGSAVVRVRVAPDDIYRRLAAAQGRTDKIDVGRITVIGVVLVGFLFLVIEGAALAMGWALARSITRSIHALFVGTERLRVGDLGHRIPIWSRDQLGELAESFNAMTANIETLLEQQAEKKRLEEELRIAREIQMSLLPRQATPMPGLGLAALCVPAREVGGDYYDIFPLGPRRVGLLVADVAGKGTSAALYMAELKGLMLSMSQIHESPRRLLVEVNRIIATNLDSRSFITMTYAIVDLDRRTLTYARAGHTPLIHRTASPPRAGLVAPSGMVVGLHLEGLEHRFEELLEEETVALADGDVFVLYTDGVSEAMNAEGDLFGEERLRLLVEEHGGLGSDGLRERIVREVEAYVGAADPHDDMTMIVLTVDGAAPA